MTIVKRNREIVTGRVNGVVAGTSSTVLTYAIPTTSGRGYFFEAWCAAVSSDPKGMSQIISGLVVGQASPAFTVSLGGTNPLSISAKSYDLPNGTPTFTATMSGNNLLIRITAQDSGATTDAWCVLIVEHLDNA